jgi:Holliday junction DNA helicase RuvB
MEASDRTFRPNTLDECLGQEETRRNLKIYIASAKARNEQIEHLLFAGSAGRGKTTLANAVAAEMGGHLITINSPSLRTKGELASIIGQIGPGDILFLDEIHALKQDLQELLYPVMEDFALEIAAGNSSISIPLAPFTIIGATTHQGKLSKPMRERFGDVCELQPYKREELTEIVLRATKKMNLQISQEGAQEIAQRSQNTPRIALRISRRVRDFSLMSKTMVDAPFVHYVCDQIGIDSAGLDKTARRMLQLLASKGKPVGLQAIASQLGEAKETIEDCVESYLLAENFVERVQSGRIITEKGIKHLISCKLS